MDKTIGTIVLVDESNYVHMIKYLMQDNKKFKSFVVLNENGLVDYYQIEVIE